jgi:hypothetical protein
MSATQFFYLHPSQELYTDSLNKMKNYRHCQAFVYGASTAIVDRGFVAPFKIVPMTCLEAEELLAKNCYTATDLDVLWALFFASGNLIYKARVHDVAEGKTKSGSSVRAAATWSYNSICRQLAVLSMQQVPGPASPFVDGSLEQSYVRGIWK